MTQLIVTDRRAPAPVQVHHQEPPEKPGMLHTVKFYGRSTGDAELWLVNRGIGIGYLHDACETKVISYFEADTLEVAA